MPQHAAMQVVSSIFPTLFTNWAIILAHPPHQERASRTCRCRCHPAAPVPAEGGRREMKVRLKWPLVPPLSA